MQKEQKYGNEFFNNYPFKISEIYHFFNYSRKDSFLRLLKKRNPDYNVAFKKINVRTREEAIIYWNEFVSLANELIPGNDEWHEYFIDFKKREFETNILSFITTNKEERRKSLYGFINAKGKFYNYSLNTYNIAESLDLCPFEVYKFCYDNYMTRDIYGKADINAFDSDKKYFMIPLFYWDNMAHLKRYEIILFLRKMKDLYKFTSIQMKVFNVYCEFIEELLRIQVEYDISIGRDIKTGKIGKNKKNEDKYNSGEIKKIYRQAALLCHPDKNESGSETFKHLNNAYHKNNYNEVENIYKTLIKE